jgi:hypothetical protein
MLRATAYYYKQDMDKLWDDLLYFVSAKEGNIVKFVAKSTPF